MKHIKPIIAAVIAVTVVAAALPFVFSAGAATNGVQEKLDELKAVYYSGTYFTVDGKPCYANQVDNCRLSRIPSRGGLPSGADVCGGSADNESWSCRSFANYVCYYLFGERYWNLKPVETPVLGDFIKFNGGSHSAIYLWEDANNYYVYDSNGDSTNVVCYGRAFSKSLWRLSGIYHAASYDRVMAGGASVIYKDLASGRYFLISALNGQFVGKPAADSKAPYALTNEHKTVLTVLAEKTEKDTTLTFSAETRGEKSYCLENVAGGFVIHSASTPKKVLTVNADNTVTLAEYTGASSQLWRFCAAVHKLSETVVKEATCVAPGEKTYTCADCGFSYTESIAPAPHVYTVETVLPGENVYSFTKYKCVNCGEVLRKDVTDKLDPDALINTGDIVQRENGLVYVSANVTDEMLLDAFPGYGYVGEPAASSGVRLVPTGSDSVPENETLTVILPGDVNGDGKIMASDARMILLSSIGMERLSEKWQSEAADIDFDGKVNAEDARWILRTSVGYASGATTLAGMGE